MFAVCQLLVTHMTMRLLGALAPSITNQRGSINVILNLDIKPSMKNIETYRLCPVSILVDSSDSVKAGMFPIHFDTGSDSVHIFFTCYFYVVLYFYVVF